MAVHVTKGGEGGRKAAGAADYEQVKEDRLLSIRGEGCTRWQWVPADKKHQRYSDPQKEKNDEPAESRNGLSYICMPLLQSCPSRGMTVVIITLLALSFCIP